MEQLTAAFPLKDLGNLVTLHDWLAANGRSVEDVRAYLAQGPRRRATAADRDAALWSYKAPRCPACGAPLLLREINLPAGRGNENGYRSEWYCADGECIYEKYNATGKEAQLAKHGLDRLGRFVRGYGKER